LSQNIEQSIPVPLVATATPAAPGFEIGLSLIGLFAWSLLAKRKNKSYNNSWEDFDGIGGIKKDFFLPN
jgi:hypothetical protein